MKSAKLIQIYSKLQKLCTCSPQRTGGEYTNCPEEHAIFCRYREVIPRAQMVERASIEENIAFYEALAEIIPRDVKTEVKRESIEEICFFLEEVVENYVSPEHQEAGEIQDLRRLLDSYYHARNTGALRGGFEMRGKLIDARNHWRVRHPTLDHVGGKLEAGQYNMRRRSD